MLSNRDVIVIALGLRDRKEKRAWGEKAENGKDD